jgi:1-acyl-sn-glycerol-3-phosphate acyltransferase
MNYRYWFFKTLAKYFLRFFYDAQMYGKENIPPTGCILVSNHVSYLDPPLIGGLLDKPIYYLARKTLFSLPMMAKFLPTVQVVPIDQDKPDMVGLKRIIHLLKNNETVLIFPEGSRSYDGKLLPAMPGIGFVIAKSNVPVVPVRVFGAHEAWPRDEKMRLFKPIKVVVGKPIFFAPVKEKSKEIYQEIGQKIMTAISEIKE